MEGGNGGNPKTQWKVIKVRENIGGGGLALRRLWR